MEELEQAQCYRKLIRPKRNEGWQRKVPINLKSMALQAVLGIISHPSIQEQDETMKERFFDFFKSGLPKEVHFDLVEHSKRSMLNPKHLIEIMEAVPSSAYIKNIDFLGKYRGTNCCFKMNNFSWINGVAHDCAVDLNALKKLSNLLDGEDKNKINTMALWTMKNIISSSDFPQILAQTNYLTSLILRGDTDDHVLRIIGLNCHVLKHLDVARSPKITKTGLRNMVCRYLDKHFYTPKNPIFESLTTLVVTPEQGNLSRRQIFSFGKFFRSFVYYIESVVPDYKLVVEKHAVPVQESLSECFGTDQRLLEDIQGLIPFDPENPDEIEVEILQPSPTEYEVKMFNEKTRLLRKSLKVEMGLGVTELTEYFKNEAWNLWELCDIADLAMRTPNLKKLTSRLVGEWDESWGALFPKLEYVDAWCLIETTIQAILQYCPSLRYINIRHVPQSENLLTHENLIEILESNSGMKSSVEEINIRPTRLTAASVLEIYRQCPKIRRIGDLQSWDLKSKEIKKINKLMYKENSQCVLVVLDLPPPA